MGIDKEPGGKIHKFENGRNIGDRVVIKQDKWEKYVREVNIPEEEIASWRERGGDVVVNANKAGTMTEEHGWFLDENPHPKAELVGANQLFIAEKMPGKDKLSPLLNSNRFLWVDSDDVEDRPFYPKE